MSNLRFNILYAISTDCKRLLFYFNQSINQFFFNLKKVKLIPPQQSPQKQSKTLFEKFQCSDQGISSTVQRLLGKPILAYKWGQVLGPRRSQPWTAAAPCNSGGLCCLAGHLPQCRLHIVSQGIQISAYLGQSLKYCTTYRLLHI